MRMVIVPVLLVLAAVLLTVPSAAARDQANPWPDIDAPLRTGLVAEHDHAVVIGIERYPFLALDVPYARRDAESFKDFLVYSRGIPRQQIQFLDEANRDQIEEAVRWAAERTPSEGTVWVYFAGHGAASASTGHRLLLGDDVRDDIARFEKGGITLEEVQVLASTGGARLVLIVDACYAGVSRSGKPLVEGARPLVPKSAVATHGHTVVWTAAGPDEIAGPLDPVRHGAFTYFAIGALRGWADGEIDGRQDGRISVAEASAYVERALRSVELRDQRPELVTETGGEWPMAEGTSERGPDLAGLSVVETIPDAPSVSFDDWGESIRNELTDETGFIEVWVEPDSAAVFVNGEEVGTGDCVLEKPIGKYVVGARLGAMYHPMKRPIALGTDGAQITFDLQPAFGALEVTSSPSGADVWIDGAKVGTTPWEVDRQLSGEYEVRISADQYLGDVALVTVQDETHTLHSVQLEPNFGELTVRSNPPGAGITLQGEDTGAVTPHTFQRITSGVVEVRLSLEGYGEAVNRPTIAPEQTALLDVNLQAKLGMLVVMARYEDGSPCKGEVRVDGVTRGTTPFKAELPAREYSVEVECGGSVLQRSASIQHNQRATLDLAFWAVGGEVLDRFGYEMVPVEAAAFVMGRSEASTGPDAAHRVGLTRDLVVGATEVTQDLYAHVMGLNPSRFTAAKKPAESVTWYDAVEFCNRLSEMEGREPVYSVSGHSVTWEQANNGYRLPTEAEWEFVARGGGTGAYAGSGEPFDVAVFGRGKEDGYEVVGRKAANDLGVFDMSGNVWEWVWDLYGPYDLQDSTNPTGPAFGEIRVKRGGCWHCSLDAARVEHRAFSRPDLPYLGNGFRIVRTVASDP